MKKNRPCPKCTELGRDKDGDHMFLMVDGKRWACLKPYHNPYYEPAEGVEDSVSEYKEQVFISKETVEEINSYSSEEIRGVPKHIVAKYGVRVSYSESTGLIDKHYYPITKEGKVVNYKIRSLPKTFTILNKGTVEPELFGMLSYPYQPDTIVITEGEVDAMSARYMLDKYPKVMCLSVPNGAGSIKAIVDNLKFLTSTHKVVICPDQDDIGREMADKIFTYLPNMYVMKFSEKDANDMLNAGKQLEFEDAFIHAKRYTPSSIVTVADVKDKAMERVQPGLSYPFDNLTRITYGLRPHRVIGIGAGPGAGKTTFIKAIQKHIIYEHKQPIGIFALEETPSDALRELAGFVMNKPLHEPECVYSDTELSTVLDSFEGLVHTYDHKGYKDWQDILLVMRQMIGMGVKYIFIDPLSALVAMLDASEANRYLGEAMCDLMRLKDSEDVTIFHVNHLNNPPSGKDHGAGGKVYAGQFSGSRAMWKFSTDIWGLERDQCAEDDSRDTVKFVNLKYRKPSKPGVFEMKYNSATGTLEEIKSAGF